MRVGSLCTGYGGIELGLGDAGVDVEMVWCAEVDTDLDPLLKHINNLGDIRRANFTQVRRVDMLTAGFPCQPVSAAGAQLGRGDPRWLWPHVLRAVVNLNPRYVLIENVRNLISTKGGALWDSILADLARAGYNTTWLTLGACHVGAAHHRHRVFALATRSKRTREPLRIPYGFCGAGGVPILPTPAATPYGSNRGGAAGRVGPVRHSLDSLAKLFPTPTARDGDGRGTGDERYWMTRALHRNQGRPLDTEVALLPARTWGNFTEAVARHESIYGPAPLPTELNRNGAPRLSADFAEWLMCIPAGYVTNYLDRVPALRAIGNGVCPPQLAAAWDLLHKGG